MVEGEVVPLPVAHGRSAAPLDEAHVGSVVPAGVGGVPRLRDVRVGLTARVRIVERAHVSTRGIRVVVDGPAVRTGRQPVAAAQRAEVVVERVILHHDHNDVLNLRQGVGARGKVRVRKRSGLPQCTVRAEPSGPGRRRVGLAPHGRPETGRDHSCRDTAGEECTAGEVPVPPRPCAPASILGHRRKLPVRNAAQFRAAVRTSSPAGGLRGWRVLGAGDQRRGRRLHLEQQALARNRWPRERPARTYDVQRNASFVLAARPASAPGVLGDRRRLRGRHLVASPPGARGRNGSAGSTRSSGPIFSPASPSLRGGT